MLTRLRWDPGPYSPDDISMYIQLLGPVSLSFCLSGRYRFGCLFGLWRFLLSVISSCCITHSILRFSGPMRCHSILGRAGRLLDSRRSYEMHFNPLLVRHFSLRKGNPSFPHTALDSLQRPLLVMASRDYLSFCCVFDLMTVRTDEAMTDD